jgi:thiol-disulfide isomerase/thioredoxin
VAAADAAKPEVKVQILDYDQLQALIASKKGKVVVMDAWSLSCPPCIEEFPGLVKLHKQHGPEKVACISLSFDFEGIGKPEEVVPAVTEFLQKQGATFDNVVSSVESDELYKKLQLAAVPAVYVYDQQGKLVKRFDNEELKKPEDAFSYEDIGELVEKLLEGQQ